MARRRSIAAKSAAANEIQGRARRPSSRTVLIASVSLFSLAAAGALTVKPASAQQAPQTLPGTQILPGGRWTGARLPTVAQTNNGLVMTIKQEQKTALLDWSRFDVGATEEVHFDQGGADWIALNRIFSADPTQIAGKITAKGQVWLANTNGVVFQGTARVNTASMLVTTAALPDSLLTTGGLLDSRPRASGTSWWGNVTGLLEGAKGDIVIEKGAKLTFKSSDPTVASNAAFLGVNVINKGEIDITDGTVVMLAGEEFSLISRTVNEAYSYDFLRGFYGLTSAQQTVYGRYNNEANWNAHMYGRAAELGMRVVNDGVIRATRSTVLIEGASIEQNGEITATSGVRQRNGAIMLRAGFGFEDATLNYSTHMDFLGGDLVLGKGSVTQVLPESGDDASPALETFTGSKQPRVALAASNITMEEDSVVRAKGGMVSVDANYTASVFGDFNGNDKGKPGTFIMKSGALIDVSGVKGVQRDVKDNIVDVEVRANELAGSPIQRDGILYGEDVKVDVRTGATIVDWTGAIANQNLTAEDRAINGGEVRIRALSSVQLENGSKIDLSGGSAEYSGGWIDVTQLTSADGKVVDIANADPNKKYTGLTTSKRYEAGYTEGGDAGSLEILSSSQKLFGRVIADTVVGERQFAAGATGVKPKIPTGSIAVAPTTRLPKGGSVTLGTGSESLGEYFFDQVFVVDDQGMFTMEVEGGQTVTLDPSKLGPNGMLSEGGYTQGVVGVGRDTKYFLLAPGWVMRDGAPVELRQALVDQGYEGEALEALLAPGAALPAGFTRGNTLRFSFIDDDFASGMQNLTILNKSDAYAYKLFVRDNAQLVAKAGGSINLSATPAFIGENVLIKAAGGTVAVLGASVGDGTVLTAAGEWTNDLDSAGQWGGFVNGGTVSLVGARLDGDVTIDASGGGWWKRTSPATSSGPGKFTLVNGKGGKISLLKGEGQDAAEFLDRADFKLAGLDGAGALELLEMGDVVIGADGGSVPEGALYLSNAMINGWGLGSLTIQGGNRSIALADLLGRVSVEGIRNPNITNQNDPAYYILRPGGVITAEVYAAILAANAQAEAYNAGLPAGAVPRAVIASSRVAADVDIRAGTKLDLNQQVLTLNLPASQIATGTDLSTVTTSGLPQAHLRNGVTFNLGMFGNLDMHEDASIKVATNGSVGFGAADMDIAGDITARSGSINLSGGALASLYVRSTSFLDARGEAVTYSTPGGAPNQTWISGNIWSGGDIGVGGGFVVVEKGARLDVSGASGMLTITAPSRLSAVRVNRLIGSDAGSINVSGAAGYLLGDLRGAAGVGYNGMKGRAGVLTIGGGGAGRAPSAELIEGILQNIQNSGVEGYGFANLQELAVAYYGYAPESIEPIPIDDPVALRAFLTEVFASIGDIDPNGYLILDPTLDQAGPRPPMGDPVFSPKPPAGYTLQTDEAGLRTAIAFLVENLAWQSYPEVFGNITPGTHFRVGGAPLEAAAGFDTVTISGVTRVASDLNLKAGRVLNIGSLAADGANVNLEAAIINFGGGGGAVLPATSGGSAVGGEFMAKAQTINVSGVAFDGFSKVTLEAERSLSGGSKIVNDPFAGKLFSSIYAPGELIIRAGQVYPYTGTALGIFSDTSVTFQKAGSRGAAPLSAGGKLIIEAPTINQGGVLAAPFGTIEFNGEHVNFLDGSLTTVAADGRTILYGYTIDGSNWWGPTPDSMQDVQLDTPPEKRILINGDNVDLQKGSVIDARGGGDVLGLEFVQGPKGASNILTGDGVFAVSAAFGADVSLGQAPTDKPREQLAVGDVIWLPAFDGNPAGYYTLLPAEYALTPGGYRVTVAAEGASSSVARRSGDGSFFLSGHQAGEQGVAFDSQTSTTFQLISGAGVRERSEFIETLGNTFFSSERFLTGLERSGQVFNADPRLPVDGGFMTIAARDSLQLNGTFTAAGATSKDRGGLLDIAGDRIVIASADTDVSDLPGYLRLDPKQLSGIAESLLIGGVRRQGAAGLEIVTGYEGRDNSGAPIGGTVGAERVVVRNGEADALTGTEILFAATGEIVFESGSVVRATGDGAQAQDIIIRPELAEHRVEWPPANYASEDRGAFVRVSNLGDVSITRTNAKTDRGDVTLESGARLEATDSIALNATRNTTLEAGAILKAGVIEAAAGSVSFGDAPTGQGGLVLSNAAFAELASAQTLRLRSFTTFDIYGDVTLATQNNLVLDGGGFVNVDGQSDTVFSAKNLTLSNTDGTAIAPTAAAGSLKINADNVTFGEGELGIGFAQVDIDAKGRVLFDGSGKVRLPGRVNILATDVGATSGSSHGIDAAGAIDVRSQATAMTLAALSTAGATLDLKGQSVSIDLPVTLSSGVFRASATTGDVTVGSKARIDVSGSAIKFYEVTEYLGAGGIGLTSESGDVTLAAGSVLNLSGGQTGDAGDLIISAGQGIATLDGELKAQAGTGGKGGAFTLQTSTLADFGGLNAKLNDSGFSRSRRFAVVNGDVELTGETRVDEFELSTGVGTITVAGDAKVITGRDKGGKILIASGGDLVLEDGALLDASAKGTGDQRGGTVSLQVGDNGSLDIGEALIRVGGKGKGEAGEVRLRARQIGGDVAVDRYEASVTGGATTLEAYRVTDLGAGDHEIDTTLQAEVIAQAAAFMSGGNPAAIRARLGQTDAGAFRITPGVEIRSGGDLTLVDDWNLADARFDGVPGVLTLRAGGDLSIDANLSDGFLSAQPVPLRPATDPASAGSPLTNDQSWSYNLVAGADFSQTKVLATVTSATGEGDVLINGLVRTGTGDINVASSGDLTYKPTRVYQFDIAQLMDGTMSVSIIYPDGTTRSFAATPAGNNQYFLDAPDLGRVVFDDGVAYGYGSAYIEAGNRVITGNLDNDNSRAKFNVQYTDGAIYTAGREAGEIANFDSPSQYWSGSQWDTPVLSYRQTSFLEKGGDITLAIGGDINGAGDAMKDAQLWYGQRGLIQPVNVNGPLDAAFAVDRNGIALQTALWIMPDRFRQGVGALGGGDVTIRAGGTVENLAVVLPTTTRVSGGRTAGEAKVLHISGGGDLDMVVGGDLLGGLIWVGKGVGVVDVDGRMDKTSTPDIENPRHYDPSSGGFVLERRHGGAMQFVLDDATLRVTTGGDARFGGIRSSSSATFSTYTAPNWLSYTERTKLEVISSGGDVQYYASLGSAYEIGDVLPAKTRLVSISGSVTIGSLAERPFLIKTDSFPGSQFELLARKDIVFAGMYNTGQSQTFNTDYGTRGYDAPSFALSWGDPNDVARALNPYEQGALRFNHNFGGGGPGYGRQEGTDSLYEGRNEYARIYAIEGDIYTVSGSETDNWMPGHPNANYGMGNFIFGYETRIKAGDDIRMAGMEFLNHDPDDVATVQAGGSIYLPDIAIYGEGRMWVQAGDEIWMGSTAGKGIRAVEDIDWASAIEDRGADVSVLAGIDQDPNYDPFFEYYLGTGELSTKPLYLSEYYTFDAIGLGTPNPTTLADGQTEVTIYAVDLVNYWNEMHGRAPISLEDDKGKPIPRGTLISKISKEDYEAAVAWLANLDDAKKQGLATRILFAELKTSGREAVGSSKGTDPSLTRQGDPSRGYAAVGKLFPGAQRKPGEAKAEGEARWFGDLIMTDSQIRTDGGGDIEILVPGGLVQLASLSISNTDPNRSGVLSQDRGNVNVLTYGDYIVNQSRTMTADDGDIMIWSSFGNIDAGKGRKTSLSIPPVIYPVDNNGITRIIRSGLPNGAGIATLNRVDGTPGGDVDLYAFNGIVNAGDAGIRASRDLFVGALEIRGLDNITVGGVTNVELNTEEAELGAINLENFAQAAEDEAVAQAFDMSAEVEKLRTVSQTILTGSVVSFGEEPGDERKKKED